MFIFSAGTENTNGVGYTFWIDEVKFEKIGTIKTTIYPTIAPKIISLKNPPRGIVFIIFSSDCK